MCNEAYRLLAFYNSNESSASTHICKLPSRYNLAYSSGSSTASEVNAKHNGIFGMNVYHVPLIPILAMILLVGLLQIVLSLVLSSNLKKETLVERIRYQG